MSRTKQEGESAWSERILALLATRSDDASICPSEVARAHGGKAWRQHMDDVRAAAWQLEARGELEVTQGGEPATREARGPIRLRRVRRS